MSSTATIQTKFNGGISYSSKSGPANSGRFMKNIDIFSDVDSATLLPAPIKDSGSTVTDLVKWMVMCRPWSSDLYAIGDTGKIYKITSAGVWSNPHTASSSAGQGLMVFNNILYYANNTTLGRGLYLDSTMAYSDDFLSDGTNNVDQSNSGTGNTYTVPTSITESATTKLDYTPVYDPLKSVDIDVSAKGTGDWTLILHDSNNTSLGTATITNANLTTGNNTFTFSSPIRVVIGQTYHFHLTSTVGDGSVVTGTTSDLSTVNYKQYFGILIDDSNYHPIVIGTTGASGQIIIGNKNYLATYDGTTYNPNKIQLLPGYQVRGITYENEFIVAYCTQSDSITETENGMYFYWDGISKYYNYAIPTQGGTPLAVTNSKNRLFSILGPQGTTFLGDQPFRKIQPVAPQLTKGKKVDVMPGAIAVWQDRVLFGYSNTDDTAFHNGIYEFGNQSDRAITYQDVSTEVMNFSYIISSGTSSSANTVKIGCIFPHGNDCYITWDDNGTYGVDKITKGATSATTASWESLINDLGVLNAQLASMPEKTKAAVKLVITHNSLPSGVTITPKYKLDRASSWTTNNANSTAATTRTWTTFNGGNYRYREIEYGFDISGGTKDLIITGVYFEFDPLMDEEMGQ